MPDLIYLIAVLACPIGIGVMMLVMMRGNHGHKAEPSSGDEVARFAPKSNSSAPSALRIRVRPTLRA